MQVSRNLFFECTSQGTVKEVQYICVARSLRNQRRVCGRPLLGWCFVSSRTRDASIPLFPLL